MGRRAIVIVLDGLGAGNAPDAADFGDEGANTLANTARATGGLKAPNLQALGLGNIGRIEGVPPAGSPRASYGLMVELSAAKATLAGHWEMMGLVLEDPLPTYPNGFPDEVLERFERATGRGVIGNRPASGTEIIEELGPEQHRTGAWILYTSADSVFQIAANTGVIPLEELYEASKNAHKMLIGEDEIMVERPELVGAKRRPRDLGERVLQGPERDAGRAQHARLVAGRQGRRVLALIAGDELVRGLGQGRSPNR